MADFSLESWEHEPLWLKLITPWLKKKRHPVVPEKPATGKWYRIYPEGCVDANGEKAYANFQLGTENKLLVYFSGGGVSWNEYTAARQTSLYSPNAKEGFYMVHVDLFTDLNGSKGIFENSERNPFRNWHKLMLHYNTGDFHAGDGDYPYTALDGYGRVLHHHGFRNYRAVMEMVKAYVPSPENLLIAGCSGGAFGVALVSDDLIAHYPECKNVTCVVDSGFFRIPNWHDIAQNVWHSPKEIVERLHSDNIMLDGLEALHRKHGDRVKILFCASVRDGSLARMMNYINHNDFSFTKEAGDECETELKQLCDEMRIAIPTVGLYFFDVPDKSQKDNNLTIHCIIGDKVAYEHSTEGKSAMEWIENAVNGRVEQIGLGLLGKT